jgi:hypothetical protein
MLKKFFISRRPVLDLLSAWTIQIQNTLKNRNNKTSITAEKY